MSDAFLSSGKDWEIQWWTEISGKEPQTVPFWQPSTSEEIAGPDCEICFFFCPCCHPWEPYKPGFPMETPRQNSDAVFLPQQWHSCRVGLKEAVSPSFTVCRWRAGPGEKTTQKHIAFLFPGHPSPSTKNTAEAAVRMGSIRLQTSWQTRGVFSGSAKLALSKLLALAPAVISLAAGNRNLGWENEAEVEVSQY